MRLRKVALAALALLLFGCDHATKLAAHATLAARPPVPLVDLRYAENPDIAFSPLHALGLRAPPAVLLAFAAIASVGVAGLWWRKRHEASFLTHAGFAMILAGALGNLVDRALHGHVVDFVHIRGWPVFNVADVAVVLGVAALLASTFRRARPPEPSRPHGAEHEA